MTLFRTKENAQRKYVDLIKEAAAKWANWDPARNIYVSIALYLFVRYSPFNHLSTKTGRRFWHRQQKDGRVDRRGEHIQPHRHRADRQAISACGVTRCRFLSDPFVRSTACDWSRGVSLESSSISFSSLISSRGITETPLALKNLPSGAGGDSTPSAARCCSCTSRD